jgi:hypothetical protein
MNLGKVNFVSQVELNNQAKFGGPVDLIDQVKLRFL